MADNRGVAYIEPGKVEIQDIDFPELELKDGPGVHPDNVGRKTPHGAILRIVSTNICGSDQHMVRGRTTRGRLRSATGAAIAFSPTRRAPSSRRSAISPMAKSRARAVRSPDRKSTPMHNGTAAMRWPRSASRSLARASTIRSLAAS